MGIVDSFCKKIEAEKKKVRIAAPQPELKLPPYGRGPGGKFTKNPKPNFPEITINSPNDFNAEEQSLDFTQLEDYPNTQAPQTPQVENAPPQEDQYYSNTNYVKVFSQGAADINESLTNISSINNRISNLISTLENQYPEYAKQYDLLPLQLGFNNIIQSLREISKIFNDGSQGKLNLKLSQAAPTALLSIGNYIQEATKEISSLYSKFNSLMDYARTSLNPVESDTASRTVLWEIALAMQTLNDSYNQLTKYNNKFNAETPPLNKPEEPKIQDNLSLQPLEPKEIPLDPQMEFLQTQEPQQVAPASGNAPQVTISEPKKAPELSKPVTPVSDNGWVDLADRDNQITYKDLTSDLNPATQKQINDWLASDKSANEAYFPYKDNKQLGLRKENGNITGFKLASTQDLLRELNLERS